MNLRSIGTYATAVITLAAPALGYAQPAGRARSHSASHVAAEMANGKLNPAESKQGDAVVVKLKDDVKSNGRVVLKKGTPITGIVRNVKRIDTKSPVQSMMEIEWLTPDAQGNMTQNVSIALQSVIQVNARSQHEPESAEHFARQPVIAVGPATRASGLSNPALLSMPSVVALDQQTSAVFENDLGVSSSGQLFKVGRGQLVTASGTHQSVDIFSRLNNDTVIASENKDFEISTGAQMRLLVGVNRK